MRLLWLCLTLGIIAFAWWWTQQKKPFRGFLATRFALTVVAILLLYVIFKMR